jgi:hypothetical protein
MNKHINIIHHFARDRVVSGEYTVGPKKMFLTA